ncbi:MAG TPA: hypothetical protein VMT58_06445, partial [Candidatus Binataceae bacterium]|nr:hypothetical protein [Candidatus Binataceae bacterium]
MRKLTKAKSTIIAGTAAMLAMAASTPGSRAWGNVANATKSGPPARPGGFLIAQDDDLDEPQVPQSQVDKYVAVYKA